MKLNQQQKIAIVLMNLPPAETAEVWSQLTPAERVHFSQVYAALPPLEGDLCEQIMQEMLRAA
jgi:flagellar motor switch protein FliG